MNKQKELVPKRRFKELQKTGAWEQRKLGDLTSLITKGTTPLDKSWIGPVNYIKTESVDSHSGNITIKSNTSLEEHEGYLKRSQLIENDILFSIVGTLGRVGIIEDKDLPANTNQQIAIIRLKDSNTNFIFNALKTDTVQSFIQSDSTIGAQPSLSLWQISDLQIYIPKYNEQQKIGQFFKHLDKMITLEQRKIDKTKALKSAYLTEMFPAEGDHVPKRRFVGFKAEWEERKLEEVVQITMGQSPNSESYTDNPSDYILVQGNADMKNNRVFPRVWTTQVTKKAVKGDLILSVRAPVGDIGKTDYDVVLGRGVASVKGNDFIFQLLMKMKKDNYWSNLSTGSTFDSINSNDIKEALVLIPVDEEQQKVGHFFKKIDNTITNHQHKLEKLKATKQAYLHEMFV